MFFQDTEIQEIIILKYHYNFYVHKVFSAHLRTVLAGVLSDISVRESTVAQEQHSSAVSSVAEFAGKCTGRLSVLRYQVAIETATNNKKIYIKISFSRVNAKDVKISP